MSGVCGRYLCGGVRVDACGRDETGRCRLSEACDNSCTHAVGGRPAPAQAAAVAAQ